ncbi:methylated-DNA--[protein]-cysteine S-methyltransferase [uncultured Methanobrevibacter sp.]|uniref:methylated-DNA--[protein]-cysteine S-methyltransferase n=1 Tax=uncultured Methanobrevibacter sp. TaxID=253161 RepID=UPI0025F295AA|nr:methylated-DNA--[protein]-cysteine S-methyltransferase [uncultured Methanobrevibacter sp.]
MYSTKYSSPIGEILLLSDGENLCGISFDSQKRDVDFIENDDLEIFKKVIGWLDDYFDGKNPKIDFNLKASGTDFRMKVWKLLSQIPYGETVTYGEIASMISPTMSAQAVGGAVGANPIAIVIPCHRVMGKDNKLTGYAAGLDKKIELLKIENGDDFEY